MMKVRINDSRRRNAIEKMIMINLRWVWCFFFFTSFGGQSRIFSLAIPPQSLSLPVNETLLAFWKMPSNGTSPSNLLKEALNHSNAELFCNSCGIEPDKLFRDRSSCRRPFSEDKEDGMFPSKELPSKKRYSKLMQSPICVGMPPER
jgi:hypothetical protein